MIEQIPDQTQVPSRHADQLIAALLERVGARFAASSVFGEAIERDGVTVIPVAAMRFGLGGGTGSDPAKGGEGAGAGGSLTAAGYIELKGSRSRFVPIVRPERMVALAVLAMLAVLIRTRPATAARRRRRLRLRGDGRTFTTGSANHRRA